MARIGIEQNNHTASNVNNIARVGLAQERIPTVGCESQNPLEFHIARFLTSQILYLDSCIILFVSLSILVHPVSFHQLKRRLYQRPIILNIKYNKKQGG